jgi:hypothetical protein
MDTEDRITSLDYTGKEITVWAGPVEIIDGTDDELEVAQEELPGEWHDRYWVAPVDGLSWEQFESLVSAKRRDRNRHEKKLNTDLWQLGDILTWGLGTFGHDFWQLFDPAHTLQYEQESLENIQRIADAMDVSRRWSPARISFWIHAVVYKLNPVDGDELLEQYAAGELTREQMRLEAADIRDGKKSGASGGSGDSSDQDTLLETCPLCHTEHAVTPDQRAEYIRHEAERDE